MDSASSDKYEFSRPKFELFEVSPKGEDEYAALLDSRRPIFQMIVGDRLYKIYCNGTVTGFDGDVFVMNRIQMLMRYVESDVLSHQSTEPSPTCTTTVEESG